MDLLDKVATHTNGDLSRGDRQVRFARADVYDALGWLSKRTRQYEMSLRYYKSGLEFADDHQVRKSLLNGLAATSKDLGYLQDAEQGYLTLLQMVRARDEKSDEVTVSNNLASLYARMGALDKAEELHDSAIEIADGISKTKSVYVAKAGLAFIKRMQEEYGSAAKLFRDTTEFFASRGEVFYADVSRAELAFCLMKLGHFDETQDLLNELRNSGDTLFQGRSYTIEAMMDVQQNGAFIPQQVVDKYERGLDILRRSDSDEDLAFDLLQFGECEIEGGRVQSGVARVEEARTIFERIQDLSEMGKINALLSSARAIRS